VRSVLWHRVRIGVAACGLPFHNCRKEALAVALISSVAYLAFAAVVIPLLVHSPKMYDATGASQLGQGIIPLALEASCNFFIRCWHKLLLYFLYAVGSRPCFGPARHRHVQRDEL